MILTRSARIYWTSVEKEYTRRGAYIESWEKMNWKLKEKYLPDS